MVGSGRRSRGGRSRRAADDPAIVDLLDTVRDVRTTLAIDLSAAAGALEENQPEIARDILAATSAELTRLGGERQHPAADQVAAARRRARRRRALIALPAVPLVGALAMTTAAALGGSHDEAAHRAVAPASPTTPASAPAQHTSATTALRRLEHVVTRHAKAAQVIAVADDLHQQLTRMIATSDNPAQLHVVRQLLALEQNVLEGSKLPGTQLALAASRAIAQLLEHRPAPSQPKHAIASHPAATATPTAQRTPSAEPTQTRGDRASQPHATSSATHTKPSPTSKHPLLGDGFLNWP
ncbi:MAG TPA: hypothetical protein VHE57_16490 [Mycobacteriales bacterium]|nr:hypothetical protein [Mycobacteriales bacterium]